MKEFFYLMGVVLSTFCCYAQEVDVILIGGQSNATGQGYLVNLPNQFKTNEKVMIYYSRFLKNGNGADQWQPLCAASEDDKRFGVELSLGTLLQQNFPDKKFALIKHALSGSNLYSQWNPGNLPGEPVGEEYAKFIQTVEAGLKELKDKRYTPVVKAMVWQQGEGDARDIAGMDKSGKYGENLRNFILQVRKEFNSPGLLFVYGEVMPVAALRFPGRDVLRKGQVDVSEQAATPLSLPHAVLVEGDDLQMRRTDYRTPHPEDDVHLGTYGILQLGERFAKVITGEMKK